MGHEKTEIFLMSEVILPKAKDLNGETPERD